MKKLFRYLFGAAFTRTLCAALSIAVLLVCAGPSQAATLVVTADAHIDGTNVAANFGSSDVLVVEQTVLGGNKAYLMFDASGWGTTNVGRVESLRVYWSASTGITRTLVVSLITGFMANDWTEEELTWNNAPANNVSGTTERNFIAYPGQTVTRLGTYQYSAGNPRDLVLAFAEGSPEELLLLEALNTGDRKATIGISYGSSQNTTVGVFSKEREAGIYAPTLTVVAAAPPDVPVSFLVEPQNTVVTTGPYRKATFTADAAGSPPITYQWLTNGVPVDGATGKTLKLPAETTELNGTLVSVRIDNDVTADPGIVSSNALLTIVEPATPDGTVPATADVYVIGTAPIIYNSYTLPGSSAGQINYGLTATSGAGLEGPNRSYLGFTLGTTRVSAAKLKLYQYWGGPEVNHSSSRLAQGTIRVYGSSGELTITEPPPQTGQSWPDNPEYTMPDNSHFVQITPLPDKVVGPEIGWYEFDITDYYNAHLGQKIVLRLGGLQISSFDTPLFEDRENTAYNAGAGGTWPETTPRIEYFLGAPHIAGAQVVGGQLVLTGSAGKYASQSFNVLSSSNAAAALSGWTPVATGQFDASGAFNISIPLNAGAPANFYILRVPAP